MNNKIKGSIGDFRNAISENKIQTPDMDKDNLISKITLSLDIEIEKIDYINEEF